MPALRCLVLCCLLAAGAAAQDGALLRGPVQRMHENVLLTDRALVDLDGDGRLDLVWRGAWPGSVITRLGLDGGGFGAVTVSPVPQSGNSNWTGYDHGDLNGDGLLDLVAVGPRVTSALDRMAILLGVGDGSFVHVGTLDVCSATTSVRQVHLADLDADGFDDALVGCAVGNELQLHRGLGDGSFAPPDTVPTGIFTSSVATLDADGDGALDVVIGSNKDGIPNLAVFLGSGSGTFGPPHVTATGPGIDQLVVADADGDGLDDVVLLDEQGTDLRVYDNSQLLGGGVPLLVPLDGGCAEPLQLAVLDEDDDGRPDLIVACGDQPGSLSAKRIDVHAGLSGGGFAAPLSQPIPRALEMDWADINADGDLDLATGYGAAITVMDNDGQGLLQSARPMGRGELCSADLDGDGRVDLVVAGRDGLHVQLGLPFGRFGPVASFPFPAAATGDRGHGAVGDLDQDGVLDVLFGVATEDPAGDLAVYRGQGDGSFVMDPPFDAVEEPEHLALGDLDGDGDLDAVARGGGSAFVHVLIGDGAAGFVPSASYVGFGRAQLADFEGDGDLDLLTQGSGVVLLYENPGDGAFLDSVVVHDDSAYQYAVADLEGDGLPDVVQLDYGEIRWHRNLGGLVFETHAFPSSHSSQSEALGLGDLDGDGQLDLVSMDADSLLVQPLAADGSVILEDVSSHDVDGWPFEPAADGSLAVLDVDGDAALDVVVVGTVCVQVLRSTRGPWTDLGQALGGGAGLPRLRAEGSLQAGSPAGLWLTDGLAGGVAALVVGFSDVSLPFKGGTLVPHPDVLVLGVPLDPQGELLLATDWPAGVPAGVSLFWQVWIGDPAGPVGFSASNALRAVTP